MTMMCMKEFSTGRRRKMSLQAAAGTLARAATGEVAHGGPGSTEYGRMLERPGPGRPLVFPYTLTAKALQFPYKLNWQRNWLFKYYYIGWLAGLPLIIMIHRMANSPENVEKWKETRQKWRDEALGIVPH
ncbi:hypothetical protein BV898_12005 [Hypsibius exemplaris]|uniref:Uncharacterized protein n=1 Tax=Hypsibius exemplaris TaxID=2072580 RepID=A0A1W0WF03_HYPEX|nr:hypothetical protein BV898_12005 [Hypsibius exemplaris]